MWWDLRVDLEQDPTAQSASDVCREHCHRVVRQADGGPCPANRRADPYYSDPLKRLIALHHSTNEFVTGLALRGDATDDRQRSRGDRR